MIIVAIVDDEKIILQEIYKKISKILAHKECEFKILSFSNGKSLLEFCNINKVDLIFLDIDMPDVNGIDVARKLRNHNNSAEIIFVTNKDEMVYEAIKYAPFRFIRKIKFDNEIEEAINYYFYKSSMLNKKIVFSTENGKKIKSVSEIVYVEVQSHKLTVHTKNTLFEANGNLNSIENIISNDGFIRIHKSYLVNFRYMDLIRQKFIILDDGTELPLSRGKADEVKRKLMKFSREM